MNDEEIPPGFVWMTLAVVVFLLAPVAIVVLAGLTASDHLGFPPEGLSLRWVRAFLASELFRSAYLFSLVLATLAAACATVLGTFAALFIVRSGWRIAPGARVFFVAPALLPGVVLGLALYASYISVDQAIGLGIARSFAGLLIGHVLVTTPVAIVIITAALSGFDRALEEAARSLGASAPRAFFAITVPVIRPNLMAAFLFTTILSFGQFEISLFLSTPDLQPLPVAMYYSLKYSFEPTAAAAGIFAIVLVIVSTILTTALLGRSRQN